MHAQKVEVSSATDKYCPKSEDLVPRVSHSSQLIIPSPCIPYIPELGEKVGVYPALLLQQIHYWTLKDFAKQKLGKLWVHNTYESWAQQLKCSLSCIRKTVKKLKQEGLIETKAFRSKYGDTTKWYSINYDALKELGLALNIESLASNEAACPNSVQQLPSTLNENQPSTPSNKNSLSLNPEHKANSRVSQCDTPLSKITKVINNLSPACAEPVYQHMISIWNETVRQGLQPIKLTQSRLKRLKRRFKIEFQSSLEKWQAFCNMISHNDFLMGLGKKGWKIYLDWALIPQNIVKILSNAYRHWIREGKEGPKAKKSSENPLRSQAEIEAETQAVLLKIDSSSHPTFWKEVSKKLVTALGVAKFESWISQLIPELLKGNELILKAPSVFMRDRVYKDFSKFILEICRQINPNLKNLEVVYDPLQTGHSKDLAGAKTQGEIQSAKWLIETSSHPMFWKEVCKLLLSQLGVGVYKSWISALVPQERYQDAITLKARSRKSLVWLKRNFSDSILECCQKLDPKIRYLEFVCE